VLFPAHPHGLKHPAEGALWESQEAVTRCLPS
jgi:hypothetical protein